MAFHHHEHSFKNIFIPLFIEVLFLSFLSLFDSYVLHFYNHDLASSVSSSLFIHAVIITIFGIFSYGSFSLITTLVGAGKFSDSQKVLKISLLFNLILALLLGILIIFLAKPFLGYFITDASLLEQTTLYLKILTMAYIPISLNPILGHYLRAYGHDLPPMIATVLGVILSMVGSVLSLFVFDWGLLGVALTTVISLFINLIIHIIYTIKHLYKFIEPRTISNKEILKKTFSIGFFAALEPLIHLLGMFIVLSLIKQIDGVSVEVFELVEQLIYITYITSFALAHANAIKTGFATGRKDYAEVIHHTKKIVRYGILVSFVLVFLMLILSPFLVTYFLEITEASHHFNHEEFKMILPMVQTIFFLYFFLEVGRSTSYILAENSIMIGDSRYLTLVVFLTFGLITILGGYLLSTYLSLGIYGFFIALVIEELVKAVWLFIRLTNLKWTKRIAI